MAHQITYCVVIDGDVVAFGLEKDEAESIADNYMVAEGCKVSVEPEDI